MKLHFILPALFMTATAVAQTSIHPDDSIATRIIPEQSQSLSEVQFRAEARPLRKIAGAPDPFYTYFWEFGDGSFSFQKEPVHQFADSGLYQVRVYATNNYDDGKPPPIRPRPVRAAGGGMLAAAATPNIFGAGENLTMKVNAMPRPDEEMVLLVGYRNQGVHSQPNISGKLALFYNEKELKKTQFKIAEVRNYHGEKPIDELGSLDYAATRFASIEASHMGGSTTSLQVPVENAAAQIKQRKDMFESAGIWAFDDLQKDEQRFLFISLVTTPEMIQDTNAVLTLSAVFIPDDPSVQTEIADLELQIVASHDPNKMMLRRRIMNYRFTGKNRKLDYKVRFQNTGEGPAKQIKITVQTPGAVTTEGLTITGMSPECIPCKDAYVGQSCLDTILYKDSIQFVFKNVYLPGVQQDGVQDIDSTKGYISYQLGFTKKPAKRPFASSAAIIFDKNEPIYTNRSVGRFLPGISPGIIAMYGLDMSNAPTVKIGRKDFNIGFSISPYAPHRKYLQAELYLGGTNEFYTETKRTPGGTWEINGRKFETKYQDSFSIKRVLQVQIVPAQLRYNLNKFIGVGAGPMIGVDLHTKEKNIVQGLVLLPQGVEELVERANTENSSFGNFRAAVFADLQIGLVRAGPAAGVRYIQSLQNNPGKLAFYLTWRL